MANNPSFSFYVNDFEGGTRHMTDAEVGCYLRVLLAQFNRGGVLPNDEKFLTRFCTSFSESWPIVKEKFHPVGENLIQNKRLEIERVKKQKFIKNQQENGRKGGRPRKPNANPEQNPEETQPFDLSKPDQKPLGNGYGKGIGKGIEEIGGAGENFLAPQMVKIFKEIYPSYPEDQQNDYPACHQISLKIGKLKGWTIESVSNGNLSEALLAWRAIVVFSKSDGWYSTRSISDFNKEFQRLIQKMTNGTVTKRTTSEKPIPSGNVKPGDFGHL